MLIDGTAKINKDVVDKTAKPEIDYKLKAYLDNFTRGI